MTTPDDMIYPSVHTQPGKNRAMSGFYRVSGFSLSTKVRLLMTM